MLWSRAGEHVQEQPERISSFDPVEKVLSISVILLDVDAAPWQVGGLTQA